MYYDNMNLVELVSLYYYIVNKDDEKILDSAKEKLGDVDYTQLKLDKDTIVRKILVANCLDSILEIIDLQMIFTKRISDGVFDFVEILVEIIEYGMMRGLMSEGKKKAAFAYKYIRIDDAGNRSEIIGKHGRKIEGDI